MSKNWVQDIHDMHAKYGVDEWMEKNKDKKHLMYDFLRFRIDMMYEEWTETNDAYIDLDAEELVDGIIDLCVFAIGTLDVFGVDAHKAWDEVLKANMNKNVGVKEGRPNPLGLPDLLKPEGWTGPNHEGNHGNISNAF